MAYVAGEILQLLPFYAHEIGAKRCETVRKVSNQLKLEILESDLKSCVGQVDGSGKVVGQVDWDDCFRKFIFRPTSYRNNCAAQGYCVCLFKRDSHL